MQNSKLRNILHHFWRSQNGQTLMELVVVVGVSVIVVGALVFATVASLRNASFSKNQAQATKLAQEGIERVRAGRDRNLGFTNFMLGGVPVDNWQDNNLWINQIGSSSYFNAAADGALTGLTSPSPPSDVPALAENVGVFHRFVILSDEAVSNNYQKQKTVTVVVNWTDFSGPHQSKLTTILRKL